MFKGNRRKKAGKYGSGLLLLLMSGDRERHAQIQIFFVIANVLKAVDDEFQLTLQLLDGGALSELDRLCACVGQVPSHGPDGFSLSVRITE